MSAVALNIVQAALLITMKQLDIEKQLARAAKRQLNREPRYLEDVEQRLDRRVAPRLREILREVPKNE